MTILFVLTWIYTGQGAGGPMVTTHDFASADSCEVARKALDDERKSWNVSTSQMRTLCVPR